MLEEGAGFEGSKPGSCLWFFLCLVFAAEGAISWLLAPGATFHSSDVVMDFLWNSKSKLAFPL